MAGEIEKPAPGELRAAVNRNDVEAARNLLERGADVEDKDKNGSTALMYAVDKGIEITSLLVDWGADPDNKNKGGYTPMLSVYEVLDECYGCSKSFIDTYMEIEGILSEAPERHRRFVENRTREAAEKTAAVEAEAEKVRHEMVSEKLQRVKGNAHKLKLKAGPKL